MPLYRYQCPVCASKRDVFKRLDDIDRLEQCLHCASMMNRMIMAPAVRGDYAGYSCPITGKWIEGRKAHQENLKQHGCRVLEPGETDNVKRVQRQADEALDRSVESTVEQFVQTLPTHKRERLVAEVEGGLDVAIERK